MTKSTLFAPIAFSLIVGTGVAGLGYLGYLYPPYAEPIVVHKIIKVVDPNYVQPPCEAQRRLKEQGLYHGKIDNVWGPESDKAYCDYMAIESMRAYMESPK